jgi:hypothetical protein
MTRLLRWLAPLLSLLAVPAAAFADAADPKVIEGGGNPLPYVVGILYTILVLALICMPSRKGV